MTALVRNHVHLVWLVLMLATGVTFWLRADNLTGVGTGVATLAIACFKGRLVILDFMELRHAPFVWRLVIEGWLFFVSILLLTVYLLGAL